MKLIETIQLKIENKKWKIENFNYHLQRVQKSFEYFKWKFNKKEWEDLKWKMENKKWKNEKIRVRVIYCKNGIESIEIFPIKKRDFKKFKIVYSDINYNFKYLNREKLNSLKKSNFDEIIIVKNSLITDTTISNIAFFDGKIWLTPKYPLLKGTKREELIKKGILKTENIHTSDLKYFKKIALINAILGFYIIDKFDIVA